MNKQNNLRGSETILCDTMFVDVSNSAGCTTLTRTIRSATDGVLRVYQCGFAGCHRGGTLVRDMNSWEVSARGQGASHLIML